jgi:hypothetical protein
MKRGGRVRPVSKKRSAQQDARAECRRIVLGRDRMCRGDCGRPATEVHELGRGAYRQSCWLNPELCLGLCRECHQWVTEHPLEAQDRGLALPGWRVEQLLNEAGH